MLALRSLSLAHVSLLVVAAAVGCGSTQPAPVVATTPCPRPSAVPTTPAPVATAPAVASPSPSASASAAPPAAPPEGVPKKAYPRVDMASGFAVDASWPSERVPNDTWAEMSSVAVGPDGNVWTFNRGKNPIQVFTPEGKLVRTWGGDVFKNPHTLRFDKEGNLWASDTGTNTVRKFTLEGKLLLTLGTPNEAGSDMTHLNQPTDQAFGPNGEIFVTDGYGNDRVIVFDKTGKPLRTWGKLGHGPGEFSLPHSVVIDSKKRVYVADRNNARIQVFDFEGKFLKEWVSIATPWHLLLGPHDEIYVCGASPMLWSDTDRIMLSIPPKDQLFLRLDTEGHLLQLWTLPKGANKAEKPGEVNWVHSMALGRDGSLYVGDIAGKRAQKFKPAGAPPPPGPK